ncbi:MAG: hypothetical protein M9905_02800 [Rhizobiaceae bacterium]|nr:hypothetical protein [Rhizobiaceae bacterium]
MEGYWIGNAETCELALRETASTLKPQALIAGRRRVSRTSETRIAAAATPAPPRHTAEDR